MMNDSVLKQTLSHPLFENVLWSRPENKRFAGKVLVIGGNLQGFSAMGQAYDTVLRAGIGEARVILPDAIQKTVGGFFEHALFTSSTSIGSFSKDSLQTLLEASQWADSVLFPGTLSKNAETAILLESFLATHKGHVILTKDAVHALITHTDLALTRPQTALIMTIEQLQKLAKASGATEAFTFELTHQAFTERLQRLSQKSQTLFVVKYVNQIIIAYEGKISSTTVPNTQEMWRVKLASHVAVWLAQQPQKPFEAVNCAVITANS